MIRLLNPVRNYYDRSDETKKKKKLSKSFYAHQKKKCAEKECGKSEWRGQKAISKQYNFIRDSTNIIIDRFPKCGQRLWFCFVCVFVWPFAHALANMSTCEFANAPYGFDLFFFFILAKFKPQSDEGKTKLMSSPSLVYNLIISIQTVWSNKNDYYNRNDIYRMFRIKTISSIAIFYSLRLLDHNTDYEWEKEKQRKWLRWATKTKFDRDLT